MKSPNYAILHFYPNTDDEINILKCFQGNGENILFHCWECFLLPDSDINNDRKKYILDRAIIKTSKQLYRTYYHKGEKSCWYNLLNDEELKKEVEKNYYDYVCTILNYKNDIKDYSYLLMIEENYPFQENDDCRALLITAKDKRDFEENVCPKIKELDKEIMIIDII